jgi:hypothetical protein
MCSSGTVDARPSGSSELFKLGEIIIIPQSTMEAFSYPPAFSFLIYKKKFQRCIDRVPFPSYLSYIQRRASPAR